MRSHALERGSIVNFILGNYSVLDAFSCCTLKFHSCIVHNTYIQVQNICIFSKRSHFYPFYFVVGRVLFLCLSRHTFFFFRKNMLA